jgi:serpin B
VAHRAELKAQPIQPVSGDLVSGINSFGFKSAGLLYNTGSNLAVSPVSLELALAMTRTGAVGTTASEMAKALELSGLSDEDIIAACRSLIWRANTGGMEAANSIWMMKNYPFSDDFVNACTGDFMADAMPLEIPGAMDSINAWASEKTHGKIDKIISQELDTDTRLVLCNALYFLGDWAVPFDANHTYDSDFASPSGTVKASFMNDERGVPYFTNDKYSMISLPFKSAENEGKYAMAFLLPAKGSDVSSMLSSLSTESFSEALSGMTDQEVDIKLPKFEYSFFTSFKDTLKALGMNEAFEDSADFSKVTSSDNDLAIFDVLHKCYVRIDELGAEAAAVTAVMEGATAAMPQEVPQFHADRPFVFAINSQEDGAIAFLGAVNDPTQK